jgi:very-short-patch-repair endonuclease
MTADDGAAEGGAPHPAEVEIRAEIATRVTFATHQCDVPVIADLVIANPLETDLEHLTLHLIAEPKVIGDRVWPIDRIPAGAEHRIRDRRVSLAGGLLEALTERMRAEVRLELRCGGRLLAEGLHPLVALARNEWGGAAAMPELLAAFVTPNDAALQSLLKDASRRLEAAGRPGSLEGYQARSRKRSWEIVAALWSAVAGRGLTYAEPPASFGRDGQKIRLPSMVLEQGLATCLDLALLFAAAVEQAGLHPVLVLTEGHALAGAWLQPQNLPWVTVEDPMEIRKAIAQDELVLFETTMATGAAPRPFAKALAEGRRRVAEAEEAAFIYALDIRQARGREIQPLATLASRPASEPDAGPPPPPLAIETPPDLPPFDAPSAEAEAPQTPEARLERWKRSLLDLSKRNRLLNLRSSATAIPIFCPDPAQLEDRLAQRKRIRLIPPPPRPGAAGAPDPQLHHLRTGDDMAERFAAAALERNEVVANLEAGLLEKRAIELYRKARADFEEGGANTLFLVLGTLRWQPPGDAGASYRAPLILLPVRLERKSAASAPYLTAHEDEPTFNLTLLQMLRQDFEIDLAGVAGPLATDEHGIDVRGIWEKVRGRVREVPGLEVVEEVVLSTFSFAKYLMWKDLADRTGALKANPFVRHLIDSPREPYREGATFLDASAIDAAIDPASLMAPLNADSSQVVAVHASAGAGDFVLEGPPGTGKSETIGNIIAHNLGLGRRVLFVSEKMAALEVVRRRLEACGLGDLCLELHSAKASKRAVLDQLGAAWQRGGERSAAAWQRKAAELATVRARLNRQVEVLHAPGPGGWSPRQAIGRALRHGGEHPLRLDWPRDGDGRGHAPTPDALARLEELAKLLGQRFAQLQPDDLAILGEVAHEDWSHGWASDLVSAAQGLGAAIETLAARRRTFLERLGLSDAGGDPAESAAAAEIAGLVPHCATEDLGFALAPDGREALATLGALLERLGEYRAARQDLSAEVADEAVAAAPLAAWRDGLARAEASLWPLGPLALRRLRKAMRAALRVEAAAPERDLPALAGLQALRAAIDAEAARLPAGTPWRGLATDLDAARRGVEAGRRLREAATRLAGFGRDLAQTRDRIRQALCDGREALEPGLPLAAAAAELSAAYAAFAASLARFRGAIAGPGGGADPGDLATLARTAIAIVGRHKRLNLWCGWVAARREAREAGLGALVAALESGSVAPDAAVACLRTAYGSWLAPILIDARPELRRFSAVGHDELIRTFRALDRELADLTAAYVRARLSGAVPARDEAGADPGYGVLSRELQKRARHKPVRQLVAEMGPALTQLTPCLMMSPLSVAQFLPPGGDLFDLVVFDEASQITVPDAIGAIARGRRCIVVGDPRQMPPTRFFERGAEEDENEEARDLESILDEALAARLPHHRLTGHYRSRHESLICFSNHAYYDGALVTYPAADTRDSAVTLRRVDGVYARGQARTNEIEARAVVAELLRRLRDPALSSLSVGIVTLNAEQQRLIEDLLDQARRADPELEPFFAGAVDPGTGRRRDPVFVKNLETVQGDERDVILLSIGYGPTEPGARAMAMNFGPLNRQGGERRLNVAITRATTEVMVFASFDPGMIDLARTSAEAVRDLRLYLDFAARGPVALGESLRVARASAYESDFELALAVRLRRLGWTVRSQVGVSRFRIDLGIVDPAMPGRFLAGVECDGASYHASPSARDRDRVRQLVLEQLGWRLFRVWSTDFFLDPDAATAALDAKLRALLDADREAAPATAASAAGEREPYPPSTAVGEGALPVESAT